VGLGSRGGAGGDAGCKGVRAVHRGRRHWPGRREEGTYAGGVRRGQREEGRGKGERKREWPSDFSYGTKQVWVKTEHENMLTVLVEHERAIREREIEKRERDQAGSLVDQFRTLQR
jgi:hypothetical protein